MPTPRQEVLTLLERYGADVLNRNEPLVFDMDAWSPAGVVWVATGCHSLTCYSVNDTDYGWRSLRDDLRYGVAPCTNAECETCHKDQ
jgi:hypothetical protein